MTGFHSVIDRPERVSRVIPPTTTIKKISAQQTNSHAATTPCRLSGAAATAPRLARVVEEDSLHPRQIIGLSAGEHNRTAWQVGERPGHSRARKNHPVGLIVPAPPRR